eukprot:PhM_4_TR36/c0_g1_i1/m.34708
MFSACRCLLVEDFGKAAKKSLSTQIFRYGRAKVRRNKWTSFVTHITTDSNRLTMQPAFAHIVDEIVPESLEKYGIEKKDLSWLDSRPVQFQCPKCPMTYWRLVRDRTLHEAGCPNCKADPPSLSNKTITTEPVEAVCKRATTSTSKLALSSDDLKKIASLDAASAKKVEVACPSCKKTVTRTVRCLTGVTAYQPVVQQAVCDKCLWEKTMATAGKECTKRGFYMPS